MWRRKRSVRVHFKAGVSDASVEGILLGVWAGHYRLAAARQIESAERSYQLEGEQLIPRENVLMLQELST